MSAVDQRQAPGWRGFGILLIIGGLVTMLGSCSAVLEEQLERDFCQSGLPSGDCGGGSTLGVIAGLLIGITLFAIGVTIVLTHPSTRTRGRGRWQGSGSSDWSGD